MTVPLLIFGLKSHVNINFFRRIFKGTDVKKIDVSGLPVDLSSKASISRSSNILTFEGGTDRWSRNAGFKPFHAA